MRVLSRDKKKGRIRLRMQSPDDLWHLHNVVEKGDLVYALTFRREEQRADKIRPERMEKKRVKLGIRVERVEFHEFSDRLRIQGVIEVGPQDLGSHHTLNLSPGDELTIEKQWKDSQLARIEQAVKASHQPIITFVSIEDDNALIAQMQQYGIKEIATIRSSAGGKRFPETSSSDEFFAKILSQLQILQVGETLVIVGPGFTKEEFRDYAKERFPQIFERSFLVSTGQAGMTGIQEALKKGVGQKVVEEARVAVETKLVEELLGRISKEGAYAYGLNDVRNAIQKGAVETLLVAESLLRKRDMEILLKETEKMGGKVVVISVFHEAGRKLESLGGLGALLRYKVDE